MDLICVTFVGIPGNFTATRTLPAVPAVGHTVDVLDDRYGVKQFGGIVKSVAWEVGGVERFPRATVVLGDPLDV